MAFRNPVYLNMQLLQNLADYHDIPLHSDTHVTRRVIQERKGLAGIDKGLQLGKEKGSAEEVTEVYETPLRPVRAMNDVIDSLLHYAGLVDLTSAPAASFAQRDVVQVEGTVSLSPVTEIGALVASVVPIFLEQIEAGGSTEELDPAAFGRILLSRSSAIDFPHVFEVDSEVPDSALYFLASPSHMFGASTIDDLEGELTLMAAVDRVIDAGNSYSLERHLLPGLSRTARRAMSGGEGLARLLESCGDLVGQRVDASALSITGPAVLLTPIAIY